MSLDEALSERQHQHECDMLRLRHQHAEEEAQARQFRTACQELESFARTAQEDRNINRAADQQKANTLSERRQAEVAREVEQRNLPGGDLNPVRPLVVGTGCYEDGSPMVKPGQLTELLEKRG